MITVSHPTGNRNVHQAALAMLEAGLLHEFWTSVAWDSENVASKYLPRRLRDELGRRTVPLELRPKTRTYPWREAGRHAAIKLGLEPLVRHELGIFSVDSVYQSLDRLVARKVGTTHGLQGVYAYEDGAAQTFAAAKSLGLKCFYDLPIGYYRSGHAIFREEVEREPRWSSTLTGLQDSPAKCARKDQELQQADAVYVASSFTRQTLSMAPTPPKKVEVIVYGAPPVAVEPPDRATAKSLRVLFVGSLGQRKGLSYLLEAVKLCGSQVELTLLGRKASDTCEPLNAAVREHRWIPSLPHAEVLREMREHDVLVFPSLFEGFGLVILEAMAQGIPVITTAHTAGPDVIREGIDGFIVPIRSAEAIAEKLLRLAGDGKLLQAMKHAARERVGAFTWANYRNGLSAALRRELSPAAMAA